MLPELPNTSLGHVMRHRKGTITISDGEEYRLCRVQLHGRGVVLRETRSGSEIKTKKQQVCRHGDLIVAEIDAKFGGIGLIDDSLDGAIVSSHYFLFEVDETKGDRRFINWFLQTHGGRSQISPQGSTNYSSVRPSMILDWVIWLPELSEQHRIVAVLEQTDRAVEAAARHAADAEALLKATIENDFSLGASSPSWKRTGLGTAITEAVAPPVSDPSSHPLLTVKLHGLGVVPSGKRPNKTRGGRPHFVRKPGEILIGRQNFHRGSAGLVPHLEGDYVTSNAISAFAVRSGFDPVFVLHLMLRPSTTEQAELLMGGTGQQEISVKKLLSLEIAAPPLAEQQAIVARIEKVEAAVRAAEAHLERLRALRSSLLENLVSGRVRLPMPDTTASEAAA